MSLISFQVVLTVELDPSSLPVVQAVRKGLAQQTTYYGRIMITDNNIFVKNPCFSLFVGPELQCMSVVRPWK